MFCVTRRKTLRLSYHMLKDEGRLKGIDGPPNERSNAFSQVC